MKIKKLPNTRRVIVEADEFLTATPEEMVSDLASQERLVRVNSVIDKMNELSFRRTAYHMWEFKTEEDARQALFILGLKQ